MKKLINAPGDVVGAALDGLTRTAAAVARLEGSTTAIRADIAALRETGQPSFLLDADEVEWGLGIHGEPGVERDTLLPAGEVVSRLVGSIVTDRGIEPGNRVALLVNGLGATPPMELSILADAAVRDLAGRDITVVRVWAGNFLTALDMAGASLSILPVDDALLAALDTPTSAPAWPRAVPPESPAVVAAPVQAPVPAGTLELTDPLRRAFDAVAETLITARDELTEMDREVGDGDLGISLARGAASLLAEAPAYPGELGPEAVLRVASATVRRSVGGTSGPLYAVLLLRAAAALPASPTPGDRAAAFRAGVSGVREVGGAAVGDCTMVDALQPAAIARALRP